MKSFKKGGKKKISKKIDRWNKTKGGENKNYKRNRECNKKENEEKHDRKKTKIKHWKQEKEETRNQMKRLAATDDPRPMSVSLRPQNKQLWEKRRGKPGGEK